MIQQTTETKTRRQIPTRRATPLKRRTKKTKTITLTPEQRNQLISETAYYLAELRNFQGGDPVQDWLTAEKKVNELFQD